MADAVISDDEVAAVQETQASGQDTAGAGPRGYQLSLPNESYGQKMTRQEVVLLAQFDPAGEFLVVKDDTSAMVFKVYGGTLRYRGAEVTYAGAVNQSLDDESTNRIYLDLSSGAAVLVQNDTGFPTDSATTPFMPLATIVTASATFAYSDITDKRRSSMWGVIGDAGGDVTVEANTAGVGAPNILTAAESGKVLTNKGAVAKNYHTLPTAAAGLTYTFIVADTDGMRIVASAADTIRLYDAVSIAAGYIDDTNIGSTVTLVAINATEWIATSYHGTWAVETS